jgi:hypothetical protein
VCAACPFAALCPIRRTRDGRYELRFTDKEQRLAARRREQATPVFAERYALRSGVESTNSGVKNRLGLKRLRVRGRGSVFRVILHTLAGWNLLRAAASAKVRAWVAEPMAAWLPAGEAAHSGQALARPRPLSTAAPRLHHPFLRRAHPSLSLKPLPA